MNRAPVAAFALLGLTVACFVAPVLPAAQPGEATGATQLGGPTTNSSPPAVKQSRRPAVQSRVYPALGSIERLDPALDALVPSETRIEKLVGGLEWAEGPVWDRKTGMLLFSDIPRNVVFQWLENVGTRDYLLPSGYTGSAGRGGEQGSNGLTFDRDHHLVLCQHGDRCVARLENDGRFTPLAKYYTHRRFNSPNDLVFRTNGDLYFTDPPYGLEKQNGDAAKELPFNGVYLVRAKGEVVLLTRDLTFPNGLAFSPDEQTLYVAVSDPALPMIMAYKLKRDGTLGEGRIFFDASSLAAKNPGLPDGLKVDVRGNLFATGPGGVLVLSPQGNHLGTIRTGELVANCAWGGDGSVLYLTSDMYLCRVKTSTRGRIP